MGWSRTKSERCFGVLLSEQGAVVTEVRAKAEMPLRRRATQEAAETRASESSKTLGALPRDVSHEDQAALSAGSGTGGQWAGQGPLGVRTRHSWACLLSFFGPTDILR